ncbi:condensin complex subunit 2/barren [Protomyces lactucae-debilis]|uniref:Condensin complex subunit 2 n=1 Tax=Protomyces lactucae-debilis TaxID=2754530 RepID=A0A1Y2FLF9_PROLT|nr:condensin complex subunit 2/barren [Protomyces lactucae-debilis]ORY84798.1 condensin complex subunit 2/barren [Protomyces lactucae-debilis]
MPAKARKFAQLSPQKTRQSPAKYVKLTEVDDAEERRERTASKLAKTQQRTQSILNEYVGPAGASSPSSRRLSGFNPDGTVSAMPRMPILANFEEWMKLATDNKINAGNSWNFALIDYFHEMSLLKDGDNINFQKASVTLDGCVKIYTNRVDSVATETGKLLSGLSSGKQAAESADADGDGEDEDADEDEEGAARKVKKKAKSSGGSTLVKDFSAIQAKKLDMEFFVDPLFKKTSAEFDEGGAKGLLLNHLSVDRNGRIIFDASDASDEVVEETDDQVYDVDLNALGQKFFPELFGHEGDSTADALADLHLCPSLKGFTTDSTVLDIPLLASLASEAGQHAIDSDANEPDHDYGDGGYDDGFDGNDGISGIVDVYDTNEEAEFGQVNEVFSEQLTHNMPGRMQATSETAVSHTGQSDQHHMYAQFDDMFSKNWAGPAHWKIARLQAQSSAAATGSVVKKPRKEKEVTTVDFLTAEGEVDEEVIFTSGGATTMLPKTQWSSKTRNLLPEDKHFNSEALLSLFMKPQAKLSARQTMQPAAEGEFVDMDENFWAQSGQEPVQQGQAFDANFFQDGEDAGLGEMHGHYDDDDDGGDAFADAKEDFGPTPEPFLQDGEPGATQLSDAADFGSQLQALGKRSKPEYVNFARTAKKVDVHVLKTNIWDKLELVGADETPAPVDKRKTTSESAVVGEERKFTEIVQSLTSVYPERQMSDISTSFCFICLLHLANEKGLEIVGEEGMRELTVRRDETVQMVEAV